APVAAPLHGSKLGELLLPVSEHVRFDAAQLPDLTNGEVALGRNGREIFLHVNQGATDRTLEFTLTFPVVHASPAIPSTDRCVVVKLPARPVAPPLSRPARYRPSSPPPAPHP